LYIQTIQEACSYHFISRWRYQGNHGDSGETVRIIGCFLFTA
jgi:hypothetical protein